MRLLPFALLVALTSHSTIAEEVKTYKWKEGNTTVYSDTKPKGRSYEERTLVDDANVVPPEGAPVKRATGAEPRARRDATQIRGEPLGDEGAAAVAEQESQQGEINPNPPTELGADAATSANPAAAASPAASGTAASSATPAAAAPAAPALLPPAAPVGP